ncbi:MAG: ATP synthase F0 subunit C, partial [Nitrospinota bacterium]
MLKKVAFLGMAVTALSFVLTTSAFAAGAVTDAQYGYYGLIGLGCVLGLGIAAFGGGIGMGNAVNGALNGIARNPGASGKITTTLLIGLALIESLVIYALVVVLIL